MDCRCGLQVLIARTSKDGEKGASAPFFMSVESALGVAPYSLKKPDPYRLLGNENWAPSRRSLAGQRWVMVLRLV